MLRHRNTPRLITVSVAIALTATFLLVSVVASERAREAPADDTGVRDDIVLDSFAEASKILDFEPAVPANTKGFVLADLRVTGPEAAPILIAVFGDADDPRRGISLAQTTGGFGKVGGMENARSTTVDGSDAMIAEQGNGVLQMYWQHAGMHFLLGSTGFSENEITNFANSLARDGT